MQTTDSSMANTVALLDRLKREMPEIWQDAQVVGKWVWLEFNIAPALTVRGKLKELGFHWNGKRKCWQNPCGAKTGRSRHDPRAKYEVTPALALTLNDAMLQARQYSAKEYKVVALRECLLPEQLQICESSEHAAQYWKLHVATNPYFNPECECFVILMLNTRRKVKAHQLVTIGTMDCLLIHPREVFRAAIIAAASAILLMHNHPSGDPTPSEGDIKVTRDLIRAGQLLKLDVLDHVIIGTPNHCSLRNLGYFFS